MRLLLTRILIVLVVVAISGVVCGFVSFMCGHPEGFLEAMAAVLVTVPASVFVLYFLQRYGTGPASVLAGTAVRFALTIGLAGFVAWKFSSLRTLAFFLSLTVAYMTSLFVETWLAWKDYQQGGSSSPLVPIKPKIKP